MAKYEDWVYEQVNDLVWDSIIEDDNTPFIQALEKQVSVGELYENGDTSLWSMDVKGMGNPDWGELEDVFEANGKDVSDYENDIIEEIEFSHNATFEDLTENIIFDYPLYVLGRMGGHWGVPLSEIDYDLEIPTGIIDKIIKDLDINPDEDYQFEYDIKDEIFDRYLKDIIITIDSNFVEEFTEAWETIKSESDYMETKEYAEELYNILEENGVF